MNPLEQSNQKMMDCAIFSEFLENGEGALAHHLKMI